MWVCKRILAALTLLLAATALLVSLAVGVGVWVVRGPVIARTTQLFARVEAALNVADEGLQHANASLARAGERLDGVRQEQQKVVRNPQDGALRRLLARTVQQQVAPELGAAHDKLHTVAEAAVVVNSVLEDVGTLPFLSTSGLDLDRLTEANGRLSTVGPAAWELSRRLADLGVGGDAADAGAQLSRVEQTLQTAQRLLAGYEPQLAQVRQRVDGLKSRTLSWITPAAVIISLVCFWIALSQVSLLAHAWGWWRQ